ncbi:hypothetical protein [Rhodococcus phenolicus]|uniref:hypothetical protein n=1 Tax=Rhodococcus phenolicus TaxID=263849 RepID=UPI00082C0FE1|nr:hypothetical protein [Rhodococcus phenolicus]
MSPAGYDPGAAHRWLHYDEAGTAASLPDESRHTNPASEVTSISELARSLSEPPLDFTERYFPAKLSFDLVTDSRRTGHLHRDGVSRNPVLTLRAGGGSAVPENRYPNERLVDLPGYNHLDVLTAAADRNDGRPERVSQEPAAFATG